MPVSGFAALPEVLPCSTTGIITPEVRSSYGGGFSVLESTAWKGVDHVDAQPSGDRPNALLPSEEELSQPASSVPLPAVTRGMVSSSLGQQRRPPSGQKKVRSCTQSVTEVSTEVSAERDRVRLSPYRVPSPSTTAAATAAKVRRSPPSGDRLFTSSSTPLLRHPVLHGPSERRSRPRSAASPLQAHSVLSRQDKNCRKHETSHYGSAIFDG